MTTQGLGIQRRPREGPAEKCEMGGSCDGGSEWGGGATPSLPTMNHLDQLSFNPVCIALIIFKDF